MYTVNIGFSSYVTFLSLTKTLPSRREQSGSAHPMICNLASSSYLFGVDPRATRQVVTKSHRSDTQEAPEQHFAEVTVQSQGDQTISSSTAAREPVAMIGCGDNKLTFYADPCIANSTSLNIINIKITRHKSFRMYNGITSITRRANWFMAEKFRVTCFPFSKLGIDKDAKGCDNLWVVINNG